MRLWKIVLALSALVSFTTACYAGPIAFNVGITSQVTPGNPSPGPLNIFVDQQGDFQVSPGESVFLGGIQFDSILSPQASESYMTSTSFTVSVAVTDTASGQSGVLRIDAAGVDWWDLRNWDGLWRNSYHNLEIGDWWLHQPFLTSTTLGGHEYLLRVNTTQEGNSATFLLEVDPGAVPSQPPVAATPEPGTMLLAGFGLLPLGAWGIRRVKISVARSHSD